MEEAGGGNFQHVYSGAGGSSFISGHVGCNAISQDSAENSITHTNQANHYSGLVFTKTKMIDGQGYRWTSVKGNTEQMPNPNGGYYTTGTGNSGNGYARITNQNGIKISSNNLIGYYDYKDYAANSIIWNNKVSNSYNINFTGTPTTDTDGGVKVDRKNSNVYGTIDLSDKKDKDLTIYMVVKANEASGDNPRIFEIPKNPTGTQNHTTPCCYKNASNNLGYSIFYGDVSTTIPATNYNVIAMRLDNTSGNDNGAGTLSFFVNNEKCASDLNYEGRGDVLYLSHATINSSGYGNNTFGMIAIYDTAHTDSEILSNLDAISNQFLE